MQEMMVTCFEIGYHCEHERSLFKEEIRTDGVTCTKHPREVQYVSGALRLNRNLHVIYVVRDPRDVVVSQHANSPGQYFAGLGYYLRADRCAERLAAHPRFLVVRYEDLVRSPDAVQDYIESQIPFLRRKHRFSEFHLHAKVSSDSSAALNGVRPPNPADIGKWRKHLPRVAAQVERFPSVERVLVRHGYEADSSWTRDLPSPDPRLSESVLRDGGGPMDELRTVLRGVKRTLRYWVRLRKQRA